MADEKIIDGQFKETEGTGVNPEAMTDVVDTPKEKGKILKALKAGANKVLDIRLRDILLGAAIVGGTVGVVFLAVGFATKGETEEAGETPEAAPSGESDISAPTVDTVEF